MNRLLAALLLSATLAPRPADPAAAGAEGGPSLRWVDRSGQAVVEVVGLDRTCVERLGRLAPASGQWPSILAVRIVRPLGEPEATPMLGRYEVADGILRFRPRYALRGGMQYIAQFRPPSISTPDHAAPVICCTYTVPRATAGPRGKVTAVYPSGDMLPENVLKLYLHFSTPMSRGEAYRRVHLEDGSGCPVERPFLEIGEELWAPQGRRLTLLFDPGRIKRGLVPREEEGPILEEGKAYTLRIDPEWPDAEGRPLAEGYRRSFRAGPADSSQPEPSRWSITPVRPGTRDALIARFPERLDHAMLGRALSVEVAGAAVAGRVEVGVGETSWSFTPHAAWPPGPVALRVNAELEDVAGNSVARPFEVDVFQQASASGPPRITVPVPHPTSR